MRKASRKYKIDKIEEWIAPKENGIEILTMPNIPWAMQGKNLQPRTIVGTSEWNKMRTRCYFKADYRCEACGKDLANGGYQAHEVFSTNFVKGEHKFERLICLCQSCHLGTIHSGRALSLYRQHSYLMNKKKLLLGVEHSFKIIYNYNKQYNTNLKLYASFIEYFTEPSIKKEMEAIYAKYPVEFYGPKKMADFPEWTMYYNGNEYKSPYKDMDDYKEKIMNQNKILNDNRLERSNNKQRMYNQIMDDTEVETEKLSSF